MDFDGLVDRYEKPIYNLIYRLIEDREEAADLTQDTFVAAYRSFSNFRNDSSVYTWLYRIAINKCKNRFKQKGHNAENTGLSLDEDACEVEMSSSTSTSKHSDPSIVLQKKELKKQIEIAISRLPIDYRIVVVLRDLQGLSYQEIADAADLSVDVVKTRLSRARGMLRKKLAPYLQI